MCSIWSVYTGAESTDKAYRKEGESWWSREMPSDEEYAEALKNLSDNHFVVDYVITHCGPEGILEIFRRENKLTRFLDSLITKYDLCFDRWFCGHYHIDESCEAIQILYDSVVNLGEMRFDAGYKDDEIFLLSSRAHCYYLKEIPPLACWWWIISPRYCNRSWAAPWNGFANEGYEMANDNICAVRPAIKYSNIKNELIKSPDFDDLFYYNNHSFKVIDSESEVAIAVVPIAFDYFDYKHRYYEVSNIRAKLHYWFNTGIWNYKLEQEMPMPKAGFKDDVIFLLSVYEYLNYRDFIPPDENVWWLRDSGGKTDNVAITDGVGQECKYSSVQNYYGIRPAIKYSKLKDSITNSSLSVGRFIFNNHPFRIIDSYNKIAIAEVPLAQDQFDYCSNIYETSDVRRMLLKWFHYGEWGYFVNTTTIGNFRIAEDDEEYSYKVFVTSDDYKIPCVQVECDDGRYIGVELLSEMYQSNNGRFYWFHLNELEKFIEFMKAPSKQRVFTVGDKEYKLRTNWDYTVAIWNEENPDYAIEIGMDQDGYMVPPTMPDYCELLCDERP